MSGSGAHGNPHHHHHHGKRAREHERRAKERRMRNSAKKRVERAEVTLDRYRARAAAILHAEGLHGPTPPPRGGYVYRILRHRATGVRVEVLDTWAEDAPPTEGAGTELQFLVLCATHGTSGPSYANARPALAAARRSHEWCTRCANVMAAPPRSRHRHRAGGGDRTEGGEREQSADRADRVEGGDRTVGRPAGSWP